MELMNLVASVPAAVPVPMEVAMAGAMVAAAWPAWRFWERRGRFAPEGAKEVPGSLGFPVLGESVELLSHFTAGNVEEFGLKRFAQHGDVFKSHVFGTPYVFMRGQHAAKMLAANEDRLVNAHQILPPRLLLGQESLLNIHGPKHKRFRRMFNDTFMGEAMKKYLPVVERTALETLGEWERGEVRVVKDEALKFTYNVIAGVVLSWGPGTTRERSLELVKVIGHNLFKLPVDLPGFDFHQAMNARKELTRMFEQEYALRRSGEIVRDDLLTAMMSAVDKDTNSGLSDVELSDNLFTMILAGHETSTNQLTWIAKLLQEHPQVKQRLKDENEAIRRNKQPGESLTWAEISKDMSYTMKVINEGLRLASLTFWYHRSVKQDFEYNGYHIPKGWNLVLDVHNLHHSPELFSDPDTFDPSRFDEAPKPFTVMPFGTGPRMCLGKDLAIMEMKVFLHYLSNHFSWHVTEPDTGRDWSGLPCPNNGVPIQIDDVLR